MIQTLQIVIVENLLDFFTTKKEGPNLNRQFYGCSRTFNKCNFFKWTDEVGNNSNSSTSAGNFSGTSRNESRSNLFRDNGNQENGGVENCFCGIPGLK